MNPQTSAGLAISTSRAPLQATLKYHHVLKHLTMGQLFEIVRGLNQDSPFVVLERMDATQGDYYAQALHRPDGTWIVEYRDGGRERHYQADAPGPGAAYRVLAGWALQLPDWREGLTWRAVYQ